MVLTADLKEFWATLFDSIDLEHTIDVQ